MQMTEILSSQELRALKLAVSPFPDSGRRLRRRVRPTCERRGEERGESWRRAVPLRGTTRILRGQEKAHERGREQAEREKGTESDPGRHAGNTGRSAQKSALSRNTARLGMSLSPEFKNKNHETDALPEERGTQTGLGEI